MAAEAQSKAGVSLGTDGAARRPNLESERVQSCIMLKILHRRVASTNHQATPDKVKPDRSGAMRAVYVKEQLTRQTQAWL